MSSWFLIDYSLSCFLVIFIGLYDHYRLNIKAKSDWRYEYQDFFYRAGIKRTSFCTITLREIVICVLNGIIPFWNTLVLIVMFVCAINLACKSKCWDITVNFCFWEGKK